MIKRNMRRRTIWITILFCFAVFAGGCGVTRSEPDTDFNSAITEESFPGEQAEKNEPSQTVETSADAPSDLLSGTSDETQTAESAAGEARETTKIETSADTIAETSDANIIEPTEESSGNEATSQTNTITQETTAKTESTTPANTEPEQTTTTTTVSPPSVEPVVVLHIEARSAAAAGLAGVPEDGIILPETIMMIEADETVADLLIRAGREHKIAVAFNGSGSLTFITGIAGLTAVNRESGWMFSVNGEYVMRGAGSVSLTPGDEVVWRYTMDSGKDLP